MNITKWEQFDARQAQQELKYKINTDINEKESIPPYMYFGIEEEEGVPPYTYFDEEDELTYREIIYKFKDSIKHKSLRTCLHAWIIANNAYKKAGHNFSPGNITIEEIIIKEVNDTGNNDFDYTKHGQIYDSRIIENIPISKHIEVDTLIRELDWILNVFWYQDNINCENIILYQK